MSWRLLYTPHAERDIGRLDPAIRRRLRVALENLALDPVKGARKLTDSALGEYRARVGDWRVIFDLRGTDIVVLRVGHRREIYRHR